MTLEKSILTNYTSMSLDERFTQLRRADTRLLDRGITDLRQYASPKSRRLALQMSNRPSVQAALNIRKTFGGGISKRGRLGGRGVNFGLARRQNGAFRGGNRLRRSNSVGRLPRSQSLQSLNSRSASPFRTRGGRGRRGRGGGGGRRGFGRRGGDIGGGAENRARSNSVGRLARSQSLQSLNGTAGTPFRNRGGRARRGRGGSDGGRVMAGRVGGGRGGRGIGQRRDNLGNRRGGGGGLISNRGRGGGRGRGFRQGGRGGAGGRGGGGRGGGGGGRRGGGQQQRQPPPSKEKLDMELDEYMASSKATLDKEIDSYMSQTQEKWE